MNSNKGRGTLGSILLAVFVCACIIILLVEEPEYIPDTEVWTHTDLRESGPGPAEGEYQLYDLYIVGSIRNNTEGPMDYYIEIVKRRVRYETRRSAGQYVPSTREIVGIVALAQVKPGEEVSWEVVIYKQAKLQDIVPYIEYDHDHFQVFVNGSKYGEDICWAWRRLSLRL